MSSQPPKTHSSAKPRPKAVLVGVQLPDVNDVDHHASLAELGRLVHTLGFEVIATVSQKRKAIVTGTIVGEGKLQELARWTGGSGKVESKVPKKHKKARLETDPDEPEIVDIEDDGDDGGGPGTSGLKADKVVFDTDLTPNQMRNLESATGAEVLDRTGVIVEIFHRHAKTREARLQVEIAQLKYLAPRLRQARGGGERQGSGTGGRGIGESAHELDSRRIRDRIAELGRELAEIQGSQHERRQRRAEQLTVALVGYTNAGKSSLMRALTGSDVLVEDKLFATLDTTIRAMHPETQPRILVSDTVGFIKKLPHDLVASFRSTLDEAADASLLLFVVDAADPTHKAQLQVTRDVLKEIDADHAPSFLILNKADCLDAAAKAALKQEFPNGIQMSTRRPEDVKALRERIIATFEKDMVEREFLVPYNRGEMLGEFRRAVRVLRETHGDDGTTLQVRGFPDVLDKLTKQLKA